MKPLDGWTPDYVIISETSPVMVVPEEIDPRGKYSKTLLKLIAVRNLSRRLLRECCSPEWRPTEK